MKKVFAKTLSLMLCLMLALSVITVMPAYAADESNIVMVRDFNWQCVTPNNNTVKLGESTEVTFDGGKSLKWVTTNTDSDWFYFNPTVAELSQYRTLYPNATVNVSTMLSTAVVALTFASALSIEKSASPYPPNATVPRMISLPLISTGLFSSAFI